MFQIKMNLVILSMMFISVSSVEYYLAYDIECGGHKCESGDCISFVQICNGIQNCEDNSDEEFCDCYTSELCYNPPTAPTVTPDQDTNELAGSSETCGEFEFTCNNGMCIDAKLKCNQKNDCGDFSDETVCTIQTESTYNSSNNQNDCGDDFRCKDGTCILFDGVCDGRMYHCADGSDEGGRCEESCLECSNPDYYRTPSGCLCTCPPNYYLAGDGVTCLDVQECEFDPPVCSQICLEERGSYSCDCFQGFILGEDGTTCLSQGDPMSIYYTVRNEIRHIVPQRRIRIVQSETGNLTSLNMDIASGLIYYSIEGNTSLHQLVVANNSRKSIANVGTVSLQALDWITQNVYFLSKQSIETNLVVNTTEEPTATPKSIEYKNYSRLMMCNFAKRHCANIKDLQVEVTAITIDPINKYLFYATQEYSINEDIAQNVVNLYRTELDGQDTRKIGVFDTTITDMAMDYRYKDLYIVKDIIIDRLNYNGERVLNMVETSTSIKGLNVFEDHLYFLSQGGLVMNQCQLFGETRVCSIFTLSPEDSELFFIAQNTRQTAGRNACLTYNCSHLCIPNYNGAVCINENGDIVDELPQWDY